MKLKNLILTAGAILSTQYAIAQNNETHIIKKSHHEYYPIVNFDGQKQ